MNNITDKKYFFYILLMVGVFIGFLALIIMIKESGNLLVFGSR